jgi:hypothetical protein
LAPLGRVGAARGLVGLRLGNAGGRRLPVGGTRLPEVSLDSTDNVTYVGGRMGARGHTRELYDKLTEGYRGANGVHLRAAEYASCDWRTAQRAYEKGWKFHTWARPIREVLQEEANAAKAQAMERAAAARAAADAEAGKARQHRIDQLATEAAVMTAISKDVQNAAILVSSLTPAMQGFTRVIMKEVLEPEADGSYNLQRPRFKAAGATTVKPLEAMKMLDAFVRMANRVTQAGETIIALGRLERGESTVNIAAVDNMTEDQAMEELAAAAEIHSRLRERRSGAGTDPDEPELH